MESLEVTNFLTIRQATLEVKPFTILIGPQANGKSVMAKLLYFFRTFLTVQYIQSIENQETKRQLERAGLEKFEQFFPRYTWIDQEFKLIYRYDDSEISVFRQTQSAKKSILKLDYSPNLAELHRKTKSHYRRKLEESKEVAERANIRQFEIFYQTLNDYIYTTPIARIFHNSVFIPAGRSFFANLQKNVFSFLANNIAIDPLIKAFGSVYESSKANYDRRPATRTVDPDFLVFRDELKQEIDKILAGQYKYEDDQDWIVTGRRRINLANASSGQQEALPLLTVISMWLYYSGRGARQRTNFFIEEPEAHLFPISQRRLVGIFSKLYHRYNHHFLLTTHSPYVLTAINNLIMASNIVQEKGQNVVEPIKAIIGKDAPIQFVDVSAYTIQDGVLTSILDKEATLIGSSVIDSVSDEFDRVFDALMELELS
ncbi:MAG: AAA family ATPase [Pyrinomonadaceae bacterium]